MFKRGGVWWTCIRHDGKKIQKSLETTDKKLAKAIDAKVRTEIIEGRYFEKQKKEVILVADLMEKYLDEHSKPNKASKSYRDDIGFSKRILKYFGEMELIMVSPKDITAFIKVRREDGVKDVTINHELGVFRHAFNLAVRHWEFVEKSPFAKVSLPKVNSKRIRYLSDDEEQRLFETLPKWLEPIVVIARETGLRLSNISNITWSQVNLFSKSIVIETTKNGEPIGLPMTDTVHMALKKLSKVRSIDSDYIFVGKGGKGLDKCWISRSFRKACQNANIENFRFHDLRHDFCSRLVQRGVDLYTVSALAGHKDIRMTQRYAHLSSEGLRSAVEVLNSDYNLTTVGTKPKKPKHVSC